MPRVEAHADECKACGDFPTKAIMLANKQRIHYCAECFAEVTTGAIRNQNMHFVGCSPNSLGDPSPWLENAVRALEEDR
jgi:hypothetical protein